MNKVVKIKHLTDRDYIKYQDGYAIPMRIFDVVGTPEQLELWAQVHTRNPKLTLFNKKDENGVEIEGQYIMFTSQLKYKDGMNLHLNSKETNYYVQTTDEEKKVLSQVHSSRNSNNAHTKFIAGVAQAKQELGMNSIDPAMLQALATITGMQNNQTQEQPQQQEQPQAENNAPIEEPIVEPVVEEKKSTTKKDLDKQ